jgi:hypothetical protein
MDGCVYIYIYIYIYMRANIIQYPSLSPAPPYVRSSVVHEHTPDPSNRFLQFVVRTPPLTVFVFFSIVRLNGRFTVCSPYTSIDRLCFFFHYSPKWPFSPFKYSLHHNTEISARRSDAKNGYGARRSNAKNL